MAAGYLTDEDLLGKTKRVPKGNNPVAPPVYGDDVISKRGTPLVPSGGQQAKMLNEQIPADYIGKPGFAAVPRDVFNTTAANPPQEIREIPKTPTWMENARAERSQQSTEFPEVVKAPAAPTAKTGNPIEIPREISTPTAPVERRMSNVDLARQQAAEREPRDDMVGKTVNFVRDVGSGFVAKNKDMANSVVTALDPLSRFVTELATGEETKATDYRGPGMLQDQSKPPEGPQEKLDRLVAEEEKTEEPANLAPTAAEPANTNLPQGVKRLTDDRGNTTGYTDGSPVSNVRPEKVEENQGVLNTLMQNRGELEGQGRVATTQTPLDGPDQQGRRVSIPEPMTMQEAVMDYASGRVGGEGYRAIRNLDMKARSGSKAAKMILLSLKGIKHGEEGATPAEALGLAKAQEQMRANAAEEGMEQAKFARDINNDQYNRNKDQKEFELEAMQTAKEMDEYAATEPERVLEQQEKVAEIGFKNEEYARSFDSLKNAPDGAYAQIYARLYRMTGNAQEAQAHFNHFIKDGKTPDGKPLNGKTIIEAFDAQYGGGQ